MRREMDGLRSDLTEEEINDFFKELELSTEDQRKDKLFENWPVKEKFNVQLTEDTVTTLI